MKITYTDKESLITSPLPEENKVTDTDMNEIKNVVNSNDDETTALKTKTQYFQTYYTAWGFTDLQGWMNQYVASKADEVILMLSGIAVKVKG